ncbi:MAG: copper amine oxidase N-terminal domain-containing protein [Clostridia bacterium]|nr:copper amine oxidase N-terminal domain-containing protein [Clostridia bacterium]
MKKIIAFVVTLFLAACLLFSVSAADKITVMLDGSEIKFDVPPQIISGRTMVLTLRTTE